MSGLVPVILCGGSGTRLWPRSRANRPKPFLSLVGQRTLFEATLDRCADEQIFTAPMVVTGAVHLADVCQQVKNRAHVQILVEPAARGTAAAIALAALRLPPDALMLVCPSDHHIVDGQAFQAAAVRAGELADQNWMVSLAIAATSPHTGFGYLQRGAPLGAHGFHTQRFVEKPDQGRAERFLASGDYAWNGGIFAFKAGSFLTELERYRPEIVRTARAAVAAGQSDGAIFHPGPQEFSDIRSESVDYAVMENTDRAAMVPVNCGWSDIGAWDALHDVLSRDDAGNSVQGKAELIECRNVLVSSDGPRVSAIGLEDMIIVVDGDEVLITTRAGAQKVGKLQGALNQ